MQARVTAAPRLRKHISSPPLARKDSDAPPRYLIVTSANKDKEIGRVQIKVWLMPLSETDAHAVSFGTVHARHRQNSTALDAKHQHHKQLTLPSSWACQRLMCSLSACCHRL